MQKEDLIKLAELVRDGKATDAEKLELIQALTLELDDMSEILKKADKNRKIQQ